MVFGRGAEVPQNWFVVLRKEGEAIGFILCPSADVRSCQITHVVHVEAEQRAHLGLGQQGFRAGEAFAPQAVKADALFPIDRPGSMRLQSHNTPPLTPPTPTFFSPQPTHTRSLSSPLRSPSAP